MKKIINVFGQYINPDYITDLALNYPQSENCPDVFETWACMPMENAYFIFKGKTPEEVADEINRQINTPKDKE